MKKIIDGKTYWNPHKGLVELANFHLQIIKWIDEGILEPSAGVTKNDTAFALCGTAVLLNELAGRIKRHMENQSKGKRIPALLRATDDELIALARANLIDWEQFKSCMIDLNIKCKNGVRVEFHPDSYFEFLSKSLDEADHFTNTGALLGSNNLGGTQFAT